MRIWKEGEETRGEKPYCNFPSKKVFLLGGRCLQLGEAVLASAGEAAVLQFKQWHVALH